LPKHYPFTFTLEVAAPINLIEIERVSYWCWHSICLE